MLGVIIILIIIVVILLTWLKPFLEYKKIGSYSEYKPVSRSLDDKMLEYSWYQVNGFKNINQTAMEYFDQVSKACTKKDLKWLNECREFLEDGLVKAGENDAGVFSLPEPIENAGFFSVLKVIKKSRKYLPAHYQGIGCLTCGEANVMHIWISLRIQQIENGESIQAGDLDYIMDAVKEVRKHSA